MPLSFTDRWWNCVASSLGECYTALPYSNMLLFIGAPWSYCMEDRRRSPVRLLALGQSAGYSYLCPHVWDHKKWFHECVLTYRKCKKYQISLCTMTTFEEPWNTLYCVSCEAVKHRRRQLELIIWIQHCKQQQKESWGCSSQQTQTLLFYSYLWESVCRITTKCICICTSMLVPLNVHGEIFVTLQSTKDTRGGRATP